MNINAVCEKEEQASVLTGMQEIKHIFHPGNTMPYVFRNRDKEISRAFLDEPLLLVRNLDEIGFLRENEYEGEMIADHTLYTCNPASREFLRSLGIKHDTAPLELNHKELKARGMEDSDLMIYGRVPMMISAGCLYRNSHDDICKKDIRNGQNQILTDRTDTDFPVLCVCKYCYNIVLNSVPLSLHGCMDKVTGMQPFSLRLYFTTETARETKNIVRYFSGLVHNTGKGRIVPPFDSFTKGHFIKSIE